MSALPSRLLTNAIFRPSAVARAVADRGLAAAAALRGVAQRESCESRAESAALFLSRGFCRPYSASKLFISSRIWRLKCALSIRFLRSRPRSECLAMPTSSAGTGARLRIPDLPQRQPQTRRLLPDPTPEVDLYGARTLRGSPSYPAEGHRSIVATTCRAAPRDRRGSRWRQPSSPSRLSRCSAGETGRASRARRRDGRAAAQVAFARISSGDFLAGKIGERNSRAGLVAGRTP